jgi:replicative DNA helicase
MRHIKKLLEKQITKVEQACFVRPDSLSTMFPVLDRYTGGLSPGDLICIGGRPGIGTTAMALNISANVATNNPDKSVVLFTADNQEQMTARILAAETSITTAEQRHGTISDSGWEFINHAAEKLAGSRLYIDDSVFLYNEFREKLDTVKNLGLIVLDQPTLISGFSDDCVEITAELKRIAQEFNVPVIVTARLPPSCEHRRNKRPRLADLTEITTGTRFIDTMLFLYRENYYKPRFEIPHITECIVAKSHSEKGTVYLVWDENLCKFSTMIITKENEFYE